MDIYYIECVYRTRHRKTFTEVDGWAIANGVTPDEINAHPINNKQAQRRMNLTEAPIVVKVKNYVYLGKKIEQ